MKRLLLFSLFGLLCAITLPAQDALNIIRLARWDDDSLPIASPNNLRLQYSGCWGLATGGREYAVIGGAAHILFFDVTAPTSPRLIGKFAGSATTVWREFKSYKNRIYAVSDNTTEGLMIFDLSQAPDTVMRTYWSNEFFNSAHTITLDTVSGRIYLNGSNVINQGILVLDVSQNPDKPTVLGSPALEGGYVHDSYVRNDTIYASSGYEGYFIFDFKDPQAPHLLASVNTGGYNHNSWLTQHGRYAFYTEEIPRGRPIRVVDLKDLASSDIEVVGSFIDFLTPGGDSLGVPHNVFIKDGLLFDSQYEDGLLIYNINDPLNPVLIGSYDTHPENTQYNGYFGNWGNYPWLPSGTIIASDMQNGLQLLRYQRPDSAPAPDCLLFPNPASGETTIRLPPEFAPIGYSYRMFSAAGQLVRENQVSGYSDWTIPLDKFSSGMYILEIRTNEGDRLVCRLIVR